MRLTYSTALFFAVLSISACKKSNEATLTDISEGAQAIGDAMASADESGGSSGNYAVLKSEMKTFARLQPDLKTSEVLMSQSIPSAQAASCSTANTFGSCSSNVMTRTFGNCTIDSATLSGTVTLTFNDGTVDNTCAMDSNGDTVDRNPNFTIAGRRGGTFTVSKTGSYGQRVTRLTSTTYTFANDGIRRVLSLNGSDLYDYTTTTTSDIGLSGTNRSGRIMNGGTLRVTNNLSSSSCDYTPSNLIWGSSCNCPTSGSWSGTCTDGKTTSLTVTGCGTATYTLDSDSESFSFDRCYSL